MRMQLDSVVGLALSPISSRVLKAGIEAAIPESIVCIAQVYFYNNSIVMTSV